MDTSQSYLGKVFVVVDNDARIRTASNLLAYEQYSPGDPLPAGAVFGDFKRIPPDTPVIVDDIEVMASGAQDSTIFAHTLSEDAEVEFGWTSTRNLHGKFINETLGELFAQSTSKYGTHAAWSEGAYIGLRPLISIVGAKLEISRIALDTLDAYVRLVNAAEADGQRVAINSAFRSYPEQATLYDGYVRSLPGYNMAAKPGWSRHQNGIAFDIAVPGGAGNPTYDWLASHATAYGFVRTVDREPWHWEYDPEKAARAAAAGTYKTSNVAF